VVRREEPDAGRRGTATRASGVPGDDLLGDGARQGRPGGLGAPVSDTGWVTTGLNRITWAAALAAVFAAVGVSAFTLPYGPTRNLVDMIDGFAIAAVALGLRMAAQRYPSRQLLTRMLPFAMAATAVTCGWAALTQSGQPFVVLAAMATGVAAYDFGLATACVITATGVVAVDVGGLAYRVDAWGLLGVPLLMILGLLIGRLILGYRVQADQSAALLAKAEQVRLEQRRTAALDERNRIAREIHDVLAHSLGSLSVQIQATRAVLTDRGDIDQAVDLLGRAQRSAAEGLTETRRALQALRSDTPPLAGALDELGADHRRCYETPVTVQVTGRARPLPPDAALALTRAAQESLVNAAKHAPHQPVFIRLDFSDGPTTLTILNPTADEKTESPRLETINGGYGLTGMRERLLLLGGSLHAGASDGNWVVTAEVPQ
jgi:signal transduction histidine kinase